MFGHLQREERLPNMFPDHKNTIGKVSLQNQQEYQEIGIFRELAYRKI